MNLPTTGPNEQKAKFFQEVGAAFEFLGVYYKMTAEEQKELQQLLFKFGARK